MTTESFTKIEKNLASLANIKPEQPWKTNSKTILLSQFSEPKTVTNRFWQVALASFLVVLSLAGLTSFVAANSLPGEPLYPLKRAYEHTKVRFTSEGELIAVHKSLVDKRVDELVEIVEEQDQQSAAAITEVETSVSEINQTVIQERSRLETSVQSEQTSAEIKENLASLVPTIEKKQTQLAAIETSLSTDSQERVHAIIGQLEELKTTINATVEPKVKGVEDPESDPTIEVPNLLP